MSWDLFSYNLYFEDFACTRNFITYMFNMKQYLIRISCLFLFYCFRFNVSVATLIGLPQKHRTYTFIFLCLLYTMLFLRNFKVFIPPILLIIPIIFTTEPFGQGIEFTAFRKKKMGIYWPWIVERLRVPRL